jgi:putative glycosyltransferase (TIGR04372 family)
MPAGGWLVSLKGRIRAHPRVFRALSLLVLALLAPLSLPLWLARVRFLRFTAINRIGHLAVEPDMFVKEGLLGRRPRYFGVVLSPPGTAANECLLEYWRQHLCVVRSPTVAELLSWLARFPYLQFDAGRYTLAINETAPLVAVQAAWGDRPSVLRLTEHHRRDGQAWLAAQGVPDGAPIVCFHCREAGYSPGDEDLHSFRNASVGNYLPAIAELTQHGYWCVRMGDPTMRRFEPMPGVVDYAHAATRADWLDVFLLATCRFFVGSASGLAQAAYVLGRPCAVANQVPLSSVLQFGPGDVAIPKLLWSEKGGRYLGFEELLRSEAANFRFSNLYREHGIRVDENTAEDIRELVLEMVERVEGRAVYTDDDAARQGRFRALMRPGHYGYGGVNRIGRAFLRKYDSMAGGYRR